MESAVNSMRGKGSLILVLTLFSAISYPALSYLQEQPTGRQVDEPAQLRLRKTVKTRDYQGRSVEGEERVIAPGDTLWRILILERGLPEKRFGRYLVLVGSLNPHLEKPNILRIGDIVFIPIRPDELLGIELPSGRGETRVYRVKRGEHLYKILREQLGVQEEQKLLSAFNKVKELNPGKKNWDVLLAGEAIRFPDQVKGRSLTTGEPTPAKPPAQTIGPDYARRLPVQENLDLLEQVMAALGNETHRGGEEVLLLPEGIVRIDRHSYPTIFNPKMEQKVILDLEGKIPAPLRSKLEAQTGATPVMSVKKGASLHETVNNLLSRLGFQPMPSNQPVVIQDGGVGLQVKGDWMVTTPEESGGRQEIIIISLTDLPGKTPDYLRDYLSFKGMNLKEIVLPSSPLVPTSFSPESGSQRAAGQIETWPRDKIALVDAFLTSYQIPFSTGYQLSVSLREGIRLETKMDRFFEFGGRKFGFFFRTAGDEVKKALEERAGVRPVELDLQSVTSRELISRLLETFGERAAYREHRFPGIERGAKDKLVLTISGFFLPNRAVLLTDREIPKDLQRFFAEKGLRVVRF